MIISALLCLDKYSLFAKTLHPVTRCSMVLSLLWHTLQCRSWASSLAAFYDLVSTTCSSIVMIEDVFLPCKIWLNQRWYSSFVLGRIDFAAPLSCSFWFSWIPLLSANKSSYSATLVSILFLQFNHLIANSYRFPFKAQSHSNFLHHPHQFHIDCISLLDLFSMQLQSIDWST